MLNNFIKWNRGKTNIRIIAMILVITLTFANVTILASLLNEVIAISQDNTTNVENVKFEVSLDEKDKAKKEITADLNSEELNLYVFLDVQNEGKLENVKIDFTNSNFELKDGTNKYSISGQSVSLGDPKVITIPIVARKDKSYNLDLLNMSSQINLKGEYIDNSGNVKEVDSNKEVKIEWNTNSVTKEQIKIEQQIITNKTYEINGENKKVVQLQIKANIENNKAPVKEEKLEIELPKLEAKPEVKVVAKNTMATNGKTNIEFEKDGSSYEYKEEEGKIYISVLNNADANKNVEWNSNAQDEFIVTYIYAEDVKITPFVSNVKATYTLYGKEGNIDNQNKLEQEEIETIGGIVNFDKLISNNIYKGYMYIGEETNYQTREDVFITYLNNMEKINLRDAGEIIDGQNVATYFKETKINKSPAQDILGADGSIKIFTTIGEEEKLLQEVKLSETSEGDNYIVKYNEEVSNIRIETSKPIKEGKIEILNEKAIKVTDKNAKITADIMKTSASLIVSENNIISKNGVAELKEPVTTIELSLDKKSISNQVENTLRITALLKTKDASNKLFKNPILNIELPAEITNAAIEDISLVNEEELKIKKYEIKTSEKGNKVLEITLEGEQTKYTENTALGGANIVIDLKEVKAESFMANKNVELKATCINNEENAQANSGLLITAKKGLVLKSYVKVDDSETEKINSNSISKAIKENSEITIKAQIINNFGEDLKNVVINATVPEGLIGNNVKKEIGTVANEEMIEISYNMKAPEDLSKLAEKLNSMLTINYTINDQQKEEIVKFEFSKVAKQEEKPTEEPQKFDKINVYVETVQGNTKLAKTDSVLNGQVLQYIVKVENISQETIKNAKLNVNIENAVFYDLTPAGVIEDESVDENGNLKYPEGRTVYEYKENTTSKTKTLNIGTINPGDTAQSEYMIVAYIGTNNTLKNAIEITADGIDKVVQTDERTIKEGALALKLQYGYSENAIAYSNSELDIILSAKNLTDKKLEKVDIALDLPNGIDCDVAEQISVEYTDGVSISKDDNNTIHIVFDEILAKKEEAVKVTLKTGKLSYDSVKASVTLVAQATVKDDKNVYTSNAYTINFLQSQAKLSTNFTSNKEGQVLKNGDEITYTLTLKNEGQIDINSLQIFGTSSDGIEFVGDEIIDSSGKIRTNNYEKELSSWSTSADIKAQDNITINIKAKVNLGASTIDKITNKLSIKNWQVGDMETTEITNKVENSNPKPVDPKPDPYVEPKEEGYSISGSVWQDLNKNGIKDNNEETLNGITVILLDPKGNIVKDKDNKEITTKTTLLGAYKFNNLEKGEYVVAFEFDNTKYAVTKYQVSGGAESNNSDAIVKKITLNGKEVEMALTATINITSSDIENIDLGLTEIGVFDLRLDKYISKVVVTNGNGTTTYDFGQEKLAKVEIGARQLARSTIVVEYELVVTNEGDVPAFVTNIVDYLPSDLEFNSEMNTDWYLDTNGVLSNLVLEPKAIEPNKTQSIKLVLTKTLTSTSTGTITNTAEIADSTNLLNIAEKDSEIGNKKAGEDDMSDASLIISIRTGGPKLYIGIVIISLMVIGTGIYLVNKKVLKA